MSRRTDERTVENQIRNAWYFRTVWDTKDGTKPDRGDDETLAAYRKRLAEIPSFTLSLGSSDNDRDEVREHNDGIEFKAERSGKSVNPKDLVLLPKVAAPKWALEKYDVVSATYAEAKRRGDIRVILAA